MAQSSITLRAPLRLLFASAGAAILLAATLLTGLYLGGETQKRFRDVDLSWRTYAGEADRRGELLNRVRAHLGYGGIIHNFKNYVLRKDATYLRAFRLQVDDFNATLADYRESGATDIELNHLKVVETTIATYLSMIPTALRAAEEDWAPARTDTLVRVDDTRALEALAALDEFWRDQRRTATQEISRAVADGDTLVDLGFRFLWGLGGVALVLYGLFFVLQRDLRQTIGLLSSELTERRAAEYAAKKFQRAVDQSPATIIITDTLARIEYVNRKFCDLTGFASAEVIGKTPKFLQSGEVGAAEYGTLRQQLARGEEWYGTFRNLKSDGSSYWAKTAILPLRDDAGTITHFIGLGEDVTERRRARDQMHRAQKMEAVGLLASGVAHDFNNILTTILGNVHLARLDAPAAGSFTEELEQIEIAAKRARNLVGQVLAFARRQPGDPRPLRAGELVREVARLMRAIVHPDIAIECKIEDEALAVLADPTRLHQVIMNLGSNAAEAIGPQTGRIVLEIARQEGDNAGRDSIRLSVIDDGPGIADDIQKTIFDPFFTTKPVGKGTGLGLSVVANLVAEMGGRISVESTPGGGARFDVVLPATDAVPASVDAPADMVNGSGSVLVIDDEPEVVATCAKLLNRLGYDARPFTDPVAGLTAFEAEPDRFALVLTDFVMPDMNGEQVCRGIRALRPDCPIVIYSAYQPGTLDLDALQPARLLEKPVEPEQLARVVRDLIADPPGH
ncbi:MAG: ATP-binding protein [Pseudomonadota bacterium]